MPGRKENFYRWEHEIRRSRRVKYEFLFVNPAFSIHRIKKIKLILCVNLAFSFLCGEKIKLTLCVNLAFSFLCGEKIKPTLCVNLAFSFLCGEKIQSSLPLKSVHLSLRNWQITQKPVKPTNEKIFSAHSIIHKYDFQKPNDHHPFWTIQRQTISPLPRDHWLVEKTGWKIRQNKNADHGYEWCRLSAPPGGGCQ